MGEKQASYVTAQSIVGTSPGRDKERDFYRTPAYAVEALLQKEHFDNYYPVLEPCCGMGDISEVLKSYGFYVTSGDKYDYGYEDAEWPHDLFDVKDFKGHIITNPPFVHVNKMIEQYIQFPSYIKMALLLKLSCLEGVERSTILQKSPLSKVLVFRKRLQMTRTGEKMKNGGMIAFAWFIFTRGYTSVPTIGWI